MANIARRYNRALGIAEFIIEGHTIKQTAQEFRVSEDTIKRDLIFLISQGYGKENERNIKLFNQVKLQLKKNRNKR